MDTLESKLQQVLLASMPEQTAGAMKEFIEQSNLMKLELQKKTVAEKIYLEEIDRVAIKILELEMIVKEYRDLETKQNERYALIRQSDLLLTEKEIRVELLIAQKERALYEKVNADYINFLSILVSNPVSERFFNKAENYLGGSTMNKDGSSTYQNSGVINKSKSDKHICKKG